MPTYRQITRLYEDGYGEVIILLTVSDTYAGLFATTGQINVDVLGIESSKRDLDIAEMAMVEDELKMIIDETAAESADDVAAVTFVLDAQDGETKRFVGVFLQPADVDAPLIAELEYSGIVRPEMSAEDVLWSGARWSAAPSPMRVWTCTVKNFFEGVIDQYALRDLIYGRQPNNPSHPDYVKGIDYLTFAASNIYNRLAYSTTSWEVYQENLAPLNKLMRALADNLEDTLSAHGFGTFTIDLAESPLGVWMSPAVYHSYGLNTHMRNEAEPYTIDFDLEREPRLGDTSELYELYIAWGNVMPEMVESPPGVEGNTEKEFSVLSCETFVDFLYRLALCLGMYVRFEFVTATNLRISFSSRAGVVRHEIWIPDAEKAGLDVGPTGAGENRTFRGFAFSMAAEGTKANHGASWYHFDTNRKLYLESDLTKAHGKKEGDNLLFTVAPVMRRFGKATGVHTSWSGGCMPHNALAKYLPTGEIFKIETHVTSGITNQLYMNVGTVGSPQILPVASVRVKIAGRGDIYYSLHELINDLSGRDTGFFETEYELTVPYLCSIRKSADGTHADDDGGRGRWRNLDLGCELTLDGTEYVVVGFERKYRTLETTMRLHRLSRFAFSQDTTTITAEVAQHGEGVYAPGDTAEVSLEAGEAIAAGDAVSVRSNGKAYRALALNSDYGRVIGIAGHDAAADESVRVQLTGIVTHAAYSFTPGSRVYLRSVAYGNPNVESNRLVAMTTTEDMYMEIGTALSSSSFRIEPGHQFVFAPGIPI